MPAGEKSDHGAWRAIGRTDVILATVFAVVLLPTSLLALSQTAEPAPTPLLILLLGLFTLVHAASFVAIRMPIAAFAVASVVMLALAVIPDATGIPAAIYPSSFAYLLCVGQVSAQRERRIGFAALCVGVLGAAIISVTPVSTFAFQLRLGIFFGLAALVTVGWAIGMLQQLRRQHADDSARARVQQAIVEERMRINRDLHDVVAHSMTVMIAQAEVARALAHEDPDTSTQALSVVINTGREALRGMRGIVAAGADTPFEPVPDIDSIARDVNGVRSLETEVVFAETGTRGLLDPAARIALRHAVREALTNAIRHTAPPRSIDVQLQWAPDQVVATVVDDGGSGPAVESPGAGIGLISIAERVRSAGGTLSATPAEPSGWTVRIELPSEDAEI